MNLRDGIETSESRFAAYVETLASALGHADRVAPLKAYCTGLLLPGERKSVEPMAARVEPGRVQAAHQSLHHFVAKADWSDDAVLGVVRAQVLPALEGQGPIRAWIVDDTGFPKKGKHSVGVARQYCGQIGKQDNCQVAVSLSVATEQASLPVAYQLYLPEGWANDPDRRAKAGVPEDVIFRTKPEIALAQIRAALAAGVSPGVVLADAGYGNDSSLRTGLTEMGLTYVVGVQSSIRLWPPDTQPLPPKPWSGRGRPPSLVRRQADHAPVSAKDLAQALPEGAWCRVTWREGSKAPLASRFAAVRVRPAHRDYWRSAPRAEEWFLIEWPQGEVEPTKYWLSTLPEDTELAGLVDQAKLRWRIERDYQELKQEIGLGHYEGRGWRGFHHHATLAIAAYGFLVSERSLIPPSAPRSAPLLKAPALPEDYRPRGAAAPSRTPRQQFNRHRQG
ncbi:MULTISPECIES: IS701 family transposase [unclassified Mesorhizobium]|uniref:IS701 family transposase n=1 Tax=unclassified Mesorhizobium TaxID=325217 RepID=UPI0019261451|nr:MULTISPECIES: IS701 family transposase [unclassified Mesorhizobium]BCG82642.1 DDE transposase [Mesorhizobium sp. 113-3-3]BCG82786.1 DDE transposase [Mesorhizobium sp. 113-3-3]BCG82937.1 DDE transposase [Mesorhizobium sp. 113-3-3]BCG83083.1 DDE transposase [Mesorhizobium sp. 113-3-3]BCG90519.1 DDE transposase [Mesorhizobium sp. 113-3-9]